MKSFIYFMTTSTVALGICLKVSPVSAACVSSDCDSLGYTMSAADCDGNPSIKCPFDSSKYFCKQRAKTCADYGYSDKLPNGYGCTTTFVQELTKFCYTSQCKQCEVGVICSSGTKCAQYNMEENSADLYGCPRVCTMCASNITPSPLPDCGNETRILCDGVYYCCLPQFASCSNTIPRPTNPDGTVHYQCYRPAYQNISGGGISSETSSTDGMIQLQAR